MAAVDEAKELRLQGNHLFRQQRAESYRAALGLYTQALDLLQHQVASANNDDDTTTTTCKEELILNYCNRSACYLVMEEYEAARDDASKAWNDVSRKTSIKAAYRLAKALVALKEYPAAKELIQHVQSLAAVGSSEEASSASVVVTEEEKKSFQDLWNQLLQSSLSTTSPEQETSIQFVKRPVSIREFIQQKELGFGNFSEICIVTHKVTQERFALKKIPKKQVADLAKRQHPNVVNEVQMERRVLLERLPQTSPFVIRMYHAFQDYEHLYYLMELHHDDQHWTDLWSQLRLKRPQQEAPFMVGCHRSQAKVWLYQLVLALEHLHRHGIVHRDIKAENILLNKRGHLVLIDFGTAKDLIETDLNGPEFVGTPDFMSPEAVTGDASSKKSNNDNGQSTKFPPATWTADLWALGALGYILQTGMTPFWTTSPYLAFLRIQRGLLTRPMGICRDECWDWVQKLMQLQPNERLGANAYSLTVENDKPVIRERQDGRQGYAEIKEHPYLAEIHQQYTSSAAFRRRTPVPTLRDLCYRAVADMAVRDVNDVDLCEQHPPGDGSRHDLLRMSLEDRRAVLHLLDRQQLFKQEPRLWSRFFSSTVEARLTSKIRPATRDVVGLTQMNDGQGKAPNADQSQFEDRPLPGEKMLEFVQLCSPLLVKAMGDQDSEERKQQVKLFRKCIARINKARPKVVVIASAVRVSEDCRKLMARINESIPVVLHEPALAGNDEETFCTFWTSGIQCLCISHRLAVAEDGKQSKTVARLQREQMEWAREQVDLVRMSKHPLFCFFSGPLHDGFPLLLLKKMARGRTLALFGPAASSAGSATKLRYVANEELPMNAMWNSMNGGKMEDDDDDLISVKSSDSNEDEADEFTSVIESSSSMETGLRWIRVDPIHADEWSYDMEWVGAKT